ncbi:MAG: SWIM zinc finger family protein, partial [Chloroflexota bacterium]|nr:SWIM zinc finger family protein [Chloroflexota bacterium]
MPDQRLTESDIRRWTDERSFGRGQGYSRGGYVLNPRRQGDTIEARCQGSRPQPYHVEITLGPDGIASGTCSCPVGSGGHCKHAVALLLTWLHEPDSFTAVDDLETALDRRSKGELVVLIRRMLARYPDLETLLELPIVGEGSPPPVDVEVIRRQARSAFAGIGYDDWGATYGVAQQLLELVEIGDDYAERESWRDAATIYQTVAQETLEHYGMLHDEEGYFHPVVNGCVEGLGECLKATEEDVQREVLLHALFDVYRWDVDFGGIDMGYQAPSIILEQATLEEKQQVAGWVRAAMPAGESWSDNHHRQVYSGFLLNLEKDQMDDEAFLRVCRETKRWRDLVDRLLALGRVEEAGATAREVSDYELLRLADIFASHDHADLAEELIRERPPTDRDSRLTVWLKERARERGDLAEALALAEELFWQQPAVSGYQELRDLALPLERWDELRTAILARLADDEKYRLLTEIHLEEGGIDRALETLKQVRASAWGWGGGPLSIQVAQAAEESRPQEAIRIYVERAGQLIAARGRGNYAEAARYLCRVRDLHHRLDEQEAWETF